MKPKIIKVILDNGDVFELGDVNSISPEDYKDYKKRFFLEKAI